MNRAESDYRLPIRKTVSAWKALLSVGLGLIAFAGIFLSTSLEFNQVAINFPWSLIIPLLITLSWGPVYGLLSISLGLVAFYPFILGGYNGWASLVPASALFLWIGMHGYGSLKREQCADSRNCPYKYNIYVIQLIYSAVRMLLYVLIFPVLLRFNPPFWNPAAYTELERSIVMIFAFKGIFVETVFVALCDVLLLLPLVRKGFGLPVPRAARYNTRVMMALVSFGLLFTFSVSMIQIIIVQQEPSFLSLLAPNEGMKLIFMLALFLFVILGGVTIRFVQRLMITQDFLQTREKQLEKAVLELNELNAELEDRVRSRTVKLQTAVTELEGFAHTISHDLKAPLRAIEAYSQMMQEDYGSDLETGATEMIRGIQSISGEMISLINRLLEYATAARTVPERAAVDSRLVIEEVLTEVRIGNPEKTIALEIRSALPVVQADPVLFKQLLRNLFSNAVKFTDRPAQILIAVGCIRQGDEWVFSFEDNGVGFNMVSADRLFQLFQRMHSPREFQGHGIGLATMKKVVDKHGGRIWIESVPGQGTTVNVALPIMD